MNIKRVRTMTDATYGHDWRKRLMEIERRLKERGVKDIKFVWGSISQTPLSHIADDVATALEAYLDGKCHPLPDIGDSVRDIEL
jgi:hypothetical protein